jgi:hypothetical protein
VLADGVANGAALGVLRAGAELEKGQGVEATT